MATARYLCSQLVTLSWAGGEAIVNLEEIQAEGGLVEAETGLPVDTEVEIRCGTVCFEGKVTEAEEHGFGWRITVAFSPRTPWSPEQFRPEHLFNPAAMLEAASGGSETT